MRTRTLIIGSGVLWTVSSAISGKETIAVIMAATHVIVYMLHTIEIKVNKILDEMRIYLSDRDLD